MKTLLTVILALCFNAVAYACPEGETCAAPPPDCGEGQVCAVGATPATAAIPTETPAPTPVCDNPPCGAVAPDTVDVDVLAGPAENFRNADSPAEDPAPVEAAPVVDLPPAPAPVVSAPDVPIQPNVYRHHFGLQLDLGVPDAAAFGFVYRPVKYVRGEVAGTYNYLSEGVRVGITALPFGRILSFTVEGGKYFDGNANKFTSKNEPVLDAVSYDYANLHAGLDFGRQRATFFIHGGMSYLSTEIKNLNQQFSGVSFGGNPTLTAWFPSFKLGLIIYLGR